MKNIYLVGFMGTGKTTVGRLLAQQLKKKFVEMDEEIERQEKKSIVEIFSKKGEPYFRKLEKRLLKGLAKESNLVISCGGGLICDEENLKILKKTGLVFHLYASAEAIYHRVKDQTHRPLLNVKEPLKVIKKLLAKRWPYYMQAHYSINTEKRRPQEIVQDIVDIVNAN